jgi:hypothetical protein
MSAQLRAKHALTKRGPSSAQRGPTFQAAKPARSPVEGVDLLKSGVHNNFISVSAQLGAKLQSEFGDLASFITTGERMEPNIPTMADLTLKYPELSPAQVASIFPSLIIAHEKRLQYDEEKNSKIFGMITMVFSEEVKDKVERAANYLAARDLADPVLLWAIVVTVVGIQIGPGDAEDAAQTVKMAYQQRYMTKHESLLTFYNSTNLLLKNMTLLAVADTPTPAASARDFRIEVR